MNRATDVASFSLPLASRRAASRKADRLFYLFLTCAIALVTLAGFTRTLSCTPHIAPTPFPPPVTSRI